MSTHIKTIEGRYESIKYPRNLTVVEYEEASLDLTRFYGGEKLGRMLQLTVTNDETAYIQLTQKQVKELSIVLSQCFDDNKYPSE